MVVLCARTLYPRLGTVVGDSLGVEWKGTSIGLKFYRFLAVLGGRFTPPIMGEEPPTSIFFDETESCSSDSSGSGGVWGCRKTLHFTLVRFHRSRIFLSVENDKK